LFSKISDEYENLDVRAAAESLFKVSGWPEAVRKAEYIVM